MNKNSIVCGSIRASTRDFMNFLIFQNWMTKTEQLCLNIFHVNMVSIQEKRAKRGESGPDSTWLIPIIPAKNMRKRVTNMSGTILFERSFTDSQRCPIIDPLIMRSTSWNLRRAPTSITRNYPFSHMKSNLNTAYKVISIFNNCRTVEVSNPYCGLCTSVNSAQKCQDLKIRSEISESDCNSKFSFKYFGLRLALSEEGAISNRMNSIEIASPAAFLPLSQIIFTKYSRTQLITTSS